MALCGFSARSFTGETHRTVTITGAPSKSSQAKVLKAHLWPNRTEGARLKSFVCTKGELISFRGFLLIDPTVGDASGRPAGPSHAWPQENVINGPELFILKRLRETFMWFFTTNLKIKNVNNDRV